MCNLMNFTERMSKMYIETFPILEQSTMIFTSDFQLKCIQKNVFISNCNTLNLMCNYNEKILS